MVPVCRMIVKTHGWISSESATISFRFADNARF